MCCTRTNHHATSCVRIGDIPSTCSSDDHTCVASGIIKAHTGSRAMQFEKQSHLRTLSVRLPAKVLRLVELGFIFHHALVDGSPLVLVVASHLFGLGLRREWGKKGLTARVRFMVRIGFRL
jgi:hypothetical protein